MIESNKRVVKRSRTKGEDKICKIQIEVAGDDGLFYPAQAVVENV